MIKTISKTAVLTAVLASVATGAMAKDWIEKVEVKRDGIDVIPVEVKANAYNYTKIKICGNCKTNCAGCIFNVHLIPLI